MSKAVSEEELVSKAVAPRVTLADLKANIAEETYFYTATLTICVLTLKNGYTVTGESACADPANYNKDIGDRLARENAERQIWPLMGYVLRQKLYEEEGLDWKARLRKEFLELDHRLTKLNSYLNQNEFRVDDHMDLIEQAKHMQGYHAVLSKRLGL